jgi:hypothetical protein
MPAVRRCDQAWFGTQDSSCSAYSIALAGIHRLPPHPGRGEAGFTQGQARGLHLAFVLVGVGGGTRNGQLVPAALRRRPEVYGAIGLASLLVEGTWSGRGSTFCT